ncbi:hypothetical protein H0I23_06855 [Cellulophaga sp. HaHaR_3_176]|uniref:hypothetical protein n=1 Tax=Cellulophaga sp. HaHaR_3_176 TaxID=1942464 RepID=UPI001C1F2FFA|nr:hypothetical protein [Cellulophaga sp. HaHaR_3_176]QWX85353.1 hypothetical protein H0I23_06855 [Cellulophaga sp. HaHaR_3_176]
MNKINKHNKLAKKRIIIESFMMLLIIIAPFLYNAHEYFPTTKNTDVSFLGFTIGANGFNNVSAHIWFLLTKFIPLYLLAIWFFTSKNWWYHVILIPMLMYTFQIFEIYYSNETNVDTENILWLLPVCMIIIPFVYFIRIKLYDKHVHGIDLEAMDAELKMYKEKERLQKEADDKML